MYADGGAKGIRTPDLLNAIQTLYQLSYDPIRSGAETVETLGALVKNYLSKRKAGRRIFGFKPLAHGRPRSGKRLCLYGPQAFQPVPSPVALKKILVGQADASP